MSSSPQKPRLRRIRNTSVIQSKQFFSKSDSKVSAHNDIWINQDLISSPTQDRFSFFQIARRDVCRVASECINGRHVHFFLATEAIIMANAMPARAPQRSMPTSPQFPLRPLVNNWINSETPATESMVPDDVIANSQIDGNFFVCHKAR